MLIGFITGVLSGLGVGGGTLLLIWLTAFAGMDQITAQGINLIYFLPCASIALFSHFRNGLVEKSVLFPAMIAGTVTAPVAAYFAMAMDVLWLRRLFGIFLLVIGLAELMKKGD